MTEKFTTSVPLQCPDCGELHSEFLDSIAGWLCADCHARLTGAARELMALRVAYGKQKAGSNEKEIL